jgi:SAM-dependent methyltransferase
MVDTATLDRWAEYYDAIYDSASIGDVEFYRTLAARVDGPVLEIGCGTGRIYLELLRDGIDAYGIDRSAGMLAKLREKAAANGLDPQVFEMDMRSFDLDAQFGAILAPFRTFLHNVTVDDQLATLERVREHLQPDGLFALNFFAPDPAVIADYQRYEETVEIDGDAYTRIDEPTMADPIDQIHRTHRELRAPDGTVVWEGTFELKLLSKREFELLLELAGFSDWTVYGGFDRQPPSDAGQELVWIVDR